MNKHEVRGSIGYYKGKIEKAAGDMFDRRDWQVGGVIDQVAGTGEHVYGRAGALAQEVRKAAPPAVEMGRARLIDATGRFAALARANGERARAVVARQPAIAWSVVAALAGYALAWTIHGRRA
ncbi:CsbD family protein [Sphingomonas abaci]|uniref:Uncharacterized protein YjbJ (UPF0337 family) n=1 Tax=Sphingomonas abaci TaxID=237611 RepID=A0A7W7EYX3_9SPHN|nr:CsbD family protein [Sphingomonas abaci]MBB4616805.1 uncharacterized protein YjbJ (UPF0337 family) [Sphingomonas abaci]